MINSKTYWINRYNQGGNSGAGSFGRLAKFKADIINEFVRRNNIVKVFEMGCGDGNQLALYDFKEYVGHDVSHTCLDKCDDLHTNDKTKYFSDSVVWSAELTLSIDVIYHLLENDVYEKYMSDLFNASEKWVIIYSTNSPFIKNKAEHVRHRWFTEWVKNNRKDFHLVDVIKNKYPYRGNVQTGSSCDFYIYKKR